MASTGSRSGVLVLSVWTDESREGFRARIMRTTDASGRDRDESAVASPQDALAAVKEWLDSFAPTPTALRPCP